MLEKAIQFFEKEYEGTKEYLKNNPDFSLERRERIIADSVRMCLGISFFVQDCGVEFDDIDKAYLEISEKIKNLIYI